jgi:hypothetical protein
VADRASAQLQMRQQHHHAEYDHDAVAAIARAALMDASDLVDEHNPAAIVLLEVLRENLVQTAAEFVSW